MIDLPSILNTMVKSRSSDLYITTYAPPSMKIDGLLKKFDMPPLTSEDTDAVARSLMSPKQSAEFDRTNDLNLPLYLEGIGRFRINIFRQRGAVGLVIRHIKTDIPSFSDLQIPMDLGKIVMAKRGLILMVGSTGSGKSTTLAALIDYRNQNSAGHIITIEDPIEFVHDHKKCLITQREVGIDTETFHSALKNTLRQAPDVILLGEIRDEVTMEAAITYAETGHLVLATLHSNNAYQAVERIMNFFPEERHRQMYLQLSLNLKAIFSQRLIKSIAGSRVPALEILVDSPRVKDLLMKGKITEIKETIEAAYGHGMQTFDQALFDLYKSGKITLDEALANADSQHDIKLRIKLNEDKNSASKQKINGSAPAHDPLATGFKIED